MSDTSSSKEITLLIDIPEDKTKKIALFTNDYKDTLGPMLSRVRKRVDEFKRNYPDVTTPAGREEIASFAYKLARSKTGLDEAGKNVVAEMKELPKKIDANRKIARDTLDAWKVEILADKEAWETKESARVEKHTSAIAAIKALGDIPPLAFTVDQLDAKLKEVAALIAGDLEEFKDEYRIASRAALAELGKAVEARTRYDMDQDELARLRAAEDARQAQQEAERRQAAALKEAEDKARRDEEQKQRDRDAEAQREIDRAKSAEREALAQAAAAKANADAITAREAQRVADAEAKRLRDEQAAREAEAETKRIADAEAARKSERAKWRRKVNNAAVAALAAYFKELGKMPPELEPFAEIVAKEAITAIIMGKVPSVTVNY